MSRRAASDQVTPLLVDVKQNLDQDLSLHALARDLGYSPFHFHRLFSTTVGETPKRHVQRVRLERAAYKLAISDESIVQVGLSVGFGSHETFARAFRRGFGVSPSAYRKAAKAAQVVRMERNREFRGEGCQLSEVWFAPMRPTPLLAIRRLGEYARLDAAARAALWDELVAWAGREGLACGPLRIGLFPDDPTLTPPALQACDICIPVERMTSGDGRVRCFELAGGMYGMIEHLGPYATVNQAYRNLADGIRRSEFEFREDPPVQVFLDAQPGDLAGRSQVWFPVRRRT
jgi:AraC family transcriptional regulator